MTNPEKLPRSQQSRINGAKSKGPTSTEGKARSSANALKHGFSASINVVLSIEDVPSFHSHLDGYRASYRPLDYVEQTLVDQLAAIKWRQIRLAAIETTLLDAQMSLLEIDINKQYPDDAKDPYLHLVLGWQAIARQPHTVPKTEDEPDVTKLVHGYDINSLDLVRRYMSSAAREYHTTFNDFLKHRKYFGQPAALEPITEAPTPDPPPPTLVEIPRKTLTQIEPNPTSKTPTPIRPVVVEIKPVTLPHRNKDSQSKP